MTLFSISRFGLAFCLAILPTALSAESLWSGVSDESDIKEIRGFSAKLEVTDSEKSLVLTGLEVSDHSYRWASIPAPGGSWDLAKSKAVESKISNEGTAPVEVMFWAVGTHGWSGVGDFAKLAPGESRRFACALQENYPDGAAKVNPAEMVKLQLMVRSNASDLKIRINESKATGEAIEWVRPPGRLEVPAVEKGAPTAGRRVQYQVPNESSRGIFGALYLPVDWEKGESYPVIVEYPGNIFFNQKCYSTGRPDQCDMGYGMSEGKGAIWLSLPFIDRDRGMIVENGFGNADDTMNLCLEAVADIMARYGGDPDNLILTGFSRGSIACGYIGLRTDEIGRLWKGIHGCQHYDGSSWKESNMADAVERAKRFRGKAIYQTDNSQEKYQPVVDATASDVNWTWDQSGLGFHATAMFLDDRPSTLRLRKWYRELIQSH